MSPNPALWIVLNAHPRYKHTLHRCLGHALRYDASTSFSRSSQQTRVAPVRRGGWIPSKSPCPDRKGPAIAQHRSSPTVRQLSPDSRGYTKPSTGAADVPASGGSRSERSGAAYPLLSSAAAGPDPAAAYWVQFRSGTGPDATYGQLRSPKPTRWSPTAVSSSNGPELRKHLVELATPGHGYGGNESGVPVLKMYLITVGRQGIGRLWTA